MKRIIFIFTCLMLLIKTAIAQPTTTEDRQLRDSIFQVCHSMNKSDEKMSYLRSMFVANLTKKWAVELLDSALAISVKEKNGDAELTFRVCYYDHYKYLSDLPQMEESLKELRKTSFRLKSYKYYFLIWCDILQFYNVRGDTEHARMQSLKMEEEARQLNHEEGLACARLSFARSLAAAKKELEAIDIFNEVLKSETLNPLMRTMIHAEIVTAYQQINKYAETIKELEMQKSILTSYINEESVSTSSFKENLMEVEVNFCTAYTNLKDIDNLLKHLKEAQKYYTPDCFFSNYIGYHANWGAYYGLIHQWEDCFREFDMALAHFDNSQPLYKMIILRMKGTALINAGRHEEAAQLYKELAVMGDTLNDGVMKLHQEALQSNYNIRKALLDKERLEAHYNWIIIGLVMLLILVIWMLVHRARKVHISLHHAEHETRKALEIVDNDNKMKEAFLRNITHQIRGPLNVVVGFSEILAKEKDLTPEETQEYSVSIKKNAELLLQLITDVLDLSRLESGMMKFNISECNAVELCNEAQLTVKMQDNNKVQLSFESTTDTLNIQTDSERFLKMLFSILSAPTDYEQPMSVKYTLSSENNQLKIVVENSPLMMMPDNTQRLKHDINRLFMKSFNGTYQIVSIQNKSNIVLTYPIN